MDPYKSLKRQQERMKIWRSGGKVKCPRCENGYWSAVGDPKTTKVFRCDTCQSGMVLTIPYRKMEI